MPEYKDLVRPFSGQAMNIACVEYDVSGSKGLPWSAVEDKEPGNRDSRWSGEVGTETNQPILPFDPYRVVAKPVLSGPHHEYRPENAAA
jgi:hypothetical protein